jgi:aspartyl-tRNA(Asn)/glutamyl-tRNA(Gln) amidotransferase subunit B
LEGLAGAFAVVRLNLGFGKESTRVRYEVVIGLEVHAELATETKMFCGCATTFGADANTQTCPVCLGMPGVLPVVNRRAFEFGMRTALALQCRISKRTTFDRKNYYYPDLPKNYQISQNYEPLGMDGAFAIPAPGGLKSVRILNVHLEEDAGKLLHPEDVGGTTSLADLNRAGMPLLEIVTAPDLRSVEEVSRFMDSLRNALLYLGVSTCKMEEGKLRFEASISLRPEGQEKLGSRVEIKNLNSMVAVLKALQYEIERQTRDLDAGQVIPQETRLWNDATGRSERMRSKEEAHDYRYFPEPDLVPVEITQNWLDQVSKSVPEMPAIRARRMVEAHGLSEYEAQVLTADRALADFFEECLTTLGDAKKVSNWMGNQLLSALNEKGLDITTAKLRAAEFGRLILLVEGGAITARNASQILPEMIETGATAKQLVEARGLRQISDASGLEAAVDKVLSENPKVVADWKSGKTAALNRLFGGVMKETGGRANPAVVREVLQKKLAGL